jgi:PucR family transcriptional regulator, purine catabolism regulatory protein
MADVTEIRTDLPAVDQPMPAPAGAAVFAPTVEDVLATPAMRQARLLGGAAGLGRRVGRLPVIPGEALEDAGPYDLPIVPSRLATGDAYQLLTRLADSEIAGLVLAVAHDAPNGSRRLLPLADQLGLPLIAVPDRAVLDLEARVLAELLDRRGAALAWAERVHRGFEHIVRMAGGLQDVADELVRLLRGAVFVTTAEGRVLASSGAHRLLSSTQVPALFDSVGRCVAAQQPPGVYARPDGSGSHAVVAVVIGLEDQARIVTVREQGGFAPEELQALERAATVVALSLARRRAAAEVDSRRQGDTLRDLLEGTLPPERAIAACADFGWDVNRPLALVVSELDLPEVARRDLEEGRPLYERFASAWSIAARARDPRAAVAGISKQVVCLIGAAGDVGDLVREAAAAVGAAGTGLRGSFTTGVSRLMPSLEQLPEAYEQARRAVTVGRQVYGPGSVTDFNGLGVYRLLSLVPDGAELRSFVRETLGDLVERDDPEMRDLRQTLELLLETNLNVAETARRQHFHYNTLRYRIAKLERMLGPFTDDAHLRLNLMLALQVVRMHGFGT